MSPNNITIIYLWALSTAFWPSHDNCDSKKVANKSFLSAWQSSAIKTAGKPLPPNHLVKFVTMLKMSEGIFLLTVQRAISRLMVYHYRCQYDGYKWVLYCYDCISFFSVRSFFSFSNVRTLSNVRFP